MEKMNCDIIRDLIPSYTDEVCSEATKKCVEEHIAGCDACRQITEFCKNRMISGEKLQERELDGLKKIKGIMRLQTYACHGILLLLVLLGIWIFFLHGSSALNTLLTAVNTQTVLLILCILVTLLSCLNLKGKKSPGKREYLLGGLSLLADLYLIVIFAGLVNSLCSGETVFLGKMMYDVGPFLEKQLIAVFLLQCAFFVYNLYGIVRQDKNCSLLLCLNITGIFLLLRCDLLMKYMDSFETLRKTYLQDMLTVTLTGLAGIIAGTVIQKIIRRKTGA